MSISIADQTGCYFNSPKTGGLSNDAWISKIFGLFFSSKHVTVCKGDEAMQDLLKNIVQALVDNPEEIKITTVEGKQVIILELKVAKEDIGKVIGKQGRTAHAIRTILGAASAKIKKRANLEIID